jgi:autotransporter passenger strand-loop-strand repeat protein
MSVTYIFETASGLTGSTTSTTSGITLNSNELLAVTSGSTVTGTILQVSAVDLTGSGTAVSNPGNGQWVVSGGNVVVNGVTETLDGGGLIVTSGGIANTTSAGAGTGIIVLGGTTSGTSLNGGFEAIFSGGVTNTTSMSGGIQDIYSGGTASGTLVYQGATQAVHSGGTAAGSLVATYSTQDVEAGGTASATVVNGGGTLLVRAGGTATASSNAGGVTNVFGVDATATLSSGGVENVMAGGQATSTVVTSGGQQIISAGGIATGASVETLGTQTVASGGHAGGSQVFGGTVVVTSGGIADKLVMSTGEVIIKSGGLATGAIGNGGLIDVTSGGLVSGTALNGGQMLLLGGTATNTLVLGGGSVIVGSGGVANGVSIQAASNETVYAGGTASGIAVNGTGVLSLDSGATVVGDIVMTGNGGTVQIVGTSVPAIKIDGFVAGDKIDLTNITGGTGATYANGVLTVTGASSAASISLGSAPDGTLVLSHDAAGGIVISVQALTAAQAVAGTLPGNVAVADSAANVQANIAGLESLSAAGRLDGITLSDTGLVSLSVTAAQSDLLAKISGTFAATVDASAANATVTGAAGHGVTAVFTGSASQYSIAGTGDGVSFTVTDSGTGRTSVDHLTNVQVLHFSNANEVIATTTPAGGAALSSANIAELYASGLGRAPDAAGLAYYEAQLKAAPTLSGANVAAWFLASPEYTGLHNYAQTAAGDSQFVSDLYTNLLHRSGSSAEITYYTNIINQFTTGQTAGSAAYTQAELAGHSVVLADFSASPEFLANIQITAQHPVDAQHWLVLI